MVRMASVKVEAADLPKVKVFFSATAELLRALADSGPQPEPVMAAADKVRQAVAALGGRDIGPPPPAG